MSKLKIFINPDTKEVKKFWHSLENKERRAFLWDVEEKDRLDWLIVLNEKAHSYLAWCEGNPCAYLVQSPLSYPGCVELHFLCSVKYKKVFPALGNAVFFELAKDFDNLFCVVPGKFTGTLAMLVELGFAKGPLFYRDIKVNGHKMKGQFLWRDLRATPVTHVNNVEILLW